MAVAFQSYRKTKRMHKGHPQEKKRNLAAIWPPAACQQ